MAGNVVPHSDMQRELGVVAGPRDELAEAAVRKPGAGILRDRMDHVPFAAIDQDLGDDLADGPAFRDRVEVALALGTGADGKIVVAQGGRFRENRRRHRDGVIGGKCRPAPPARRGGWRDGARAWSGSAARSRRQGS